MPQRRSRCWRRRPPITKPRNSRTLLTITDQDPAETPAGFCPFAISLPVAYWNVDLVKQAGGSGAAGEIPVSHEPPTYAVVLIDAERVIVHFDDFLYDRPRFQLSDVDYNFWEEQQRRSTYVGKKEKQVTVPEKNQ